MKTAKNEAFYWEPLEDEDRGNDIHDLLLEYSRANATQRLHLWLSYRDLRREFDSVAAMVDGDSGKSGGWFKRLRGLPRSG